MRASDQLEDMESRHRSVGEWVYLAVDNAHAAERLMTESTLKPQALYMVQQSMEAATKALARSVGMSHDEVYGHNNLNLLIKSMRKVIDDSDTAAYCNEMLSSHLSGVDDYDVVRHIQNVLSLTSAPSDWEHDQGADRLFESALTASAAEVKLMLDQLHTIDDKMRSLSGRRVLRKRLRRKEFSLRVSPSDTDPGGSVVRQVMEQCFGNQSSRQECESENAILSELGRFLASEVVAKNGGHAVVKGKTIIQHVDTVLIDSQMANFGILIIGSLVWPHAPYCRYPAPPDAPDSLQQAAKLQAGKRRQIGRRHYTEAMGVIEHSERLTRRAKKTADLLKKCYEVGYYQPPLKLYRDAA